MPLQSEYPTSADVESARSVDALYGDPRGGYAEPGARVTQLPARDVVSALNQRDGISNYAVDTTSDRQTSDMYYRGALAANRSAIAGLGFDPSRVASTPESDKHWTASGVYSPKQDMIWVDQKYPSTVLHESIHRGFEQLRNSGYNIPEDAEELYVRAIMQKHFGDVELGAGKANDEQIARAKYAMREYPAVGRFLDEMERAAAQLVKERRPRGPR